MMNVIGIRRLFILTPLAILSLIMGTQLPSEAAETKVPVTFSDGHETERRDGGRPIVLIAAALEVKPDVFRKAFSGVTPARDGRPSPDEARNNKAALMKVLRPLGVTNDRLDEVSNFYRYRPQRGELWTNSPAKAHAIVENGKIRKIVITEAGAGYSSAPTISIKGFENTTFVATVHFDKDLKKNGAIDSIKVATSEKGSKTEE